MAQRLIVLIFISIFILHIGVVSAQNMAIGEFAIFNDPESLDPVANNKVNPGENIKITFLISNDGSEDQFDTSVRAKNEEWGIDVETKIHYIQHEDLKQASVEFTIPPGLNQMVIM